MHKIVLIGNTISLKNSKQIVVTGNGRRRVIASDAYQAWAEAVLWQLQSSPYRGYPWRYPLRVSFYFYRKTRQHFDWLNISQGPMDLLQQAGIIEEDDMNHIIPGTWAWEVDKENPRVEMTIEELGQ